MLSVYTFKVHKPKHEQVMNNIKMYISATA